MANKAAIVLLVFAFLASSLFATLAYAQTSIPKPSVPEFTLKYVDNSYDVPATPPTSPTYTIDPYSGNQTILKYGSPGNPGYHVENKTIEVWIKNQQYSYSNGSTNFHLYYNVRTKGHFGQNWTEYYPTRYLNSVSFDIAPNGSLSKYLNYYSPIPSNSEFTILPWKSYYAVGDQIDYQVKAIIGHQSQYYEVSHNGYFGYEGYSPATAFDIDSDWSPTQTIIIPETPSTSPSPTTESTPSPTLSPSPAVTATPIQPNGQLAVPVWLYAVTAGMALAIGLLLGIAIMQRKRIRENKPNT